MKIFLKSSLLSGLLTLFFLCACVPQTSLKDIAEPHQGFYECKEATLGEEDYLETFSCLLLELCKKDHFYLHYTPKDGKPKHARGRYIYDREREILILRHEEGKGIERECSFKNGVITIEIPFGGYNLRLVFEKM